VNVVTIYQYALTRDVGINVPPTKTVLKDNSVAPSGVQRTMISTYATAVVMGSIVWLTVTVVVGSAVKTVGIFLFILYSPHEIKNL
jgi:hypothetical protein